jgi:predicted transcriptional regulator
VPLSRLVVVVEHPMLERLHQVARETDRSLSSITRHALSVELGAQAAAWPAGRPDDTAGPSRVSTSAALGRRVRPVL